MRVLMCVCMSRTYEHIYVRVCRVCMPPHEYARNKSKLESIPPGLDSFSHKYRFGTGNGNNPTPGPHKWKRAKTIEVSAEGKLATIRFEGGDTFTMKTEGEATTTGYPTLREAIPRTFPTLVRD